MVAIRPTVLDQLNEISSSQTRKRIANKIVKLEGNPPEEAIELNHALGSYYIPFLGYNIIFDIKGDQIIAVNLISDDNFFSEIAFD